MICLRTGTTIILFMKGGDDMRIETLDEKIRRYRKECEAEKAENEAASDSEAELFGEKVEKYQRKDRDDDDPR